MPSPRFQRAEQILRTLINRVVARSNLTDVSDTSSVKHVLSAVARTTDEFYFQLANVLEAFDINTARGDDLDRRAQEIMGLDKRRRGSAKAVGVVVFGRSNTSTLVNVPAGTAAETSDGVAVVTTAPTSIGIGDTESAPVAAIARFAGAAGNIPSGTVIRLPQKPAGVLTVTNPSSFTSGRDKETDDEFRTRIRDYVASLARSTVRALEFAARDVELPSGQRVVFANAVEDIVHRGFVTLYVDDGSGTAETTAAVVGEIVTAGLLGPPADAAVGGELRLFLDNIAIKRGAGFTITSSLRGVLVDTIDFFLDETSGQLHWTPVLSTGEEITADYTRFTGLIAAVQKVINGDPADYTNFPGWKAGGVQVAVLTPGVFQQTVEVGLVLSEGYGYDLVSADVAAALTSYINTLGIGVDVLRAELTATIMGVDGVQNMTMVQPASDVTILDDQIARIVASNIILT